MTRRSFSPSSSRSRYGAQLASSSGRGLLSGGAQRAAAVMYRPVNTWPSSRAVAVGRRANPVSCSTGYMKLPEASPVKGRPVRLEPWAPGARASDDVGVQNLEPVGDGHSPSLYSSQGLGCYLGGRHILTAFDVALR